MAAGQTAIVNDAGGLITKSRRSALKSSREGCDASFVIFLATNSIGASRPSEAGLEILGNQFVHVVGLDAQTVTVIWVDTDIYGHGADIVDDQAQGGQRKSTFSASSTIVPSFFPLMTSSALDMRSSTSAKRFAMMASVERAPII